MKAIIPLAGKGTRMRPLTHHTPKPLLKVGGRPVLSYLLDDVMAAGVDEMVFVVGYLQNVLRDFIASEYPDLKAHFVVQEVQNGTAGAIGLGEEFIDEDLFVLFSDALFDADLSLASRLDPDESGILWAKEVEDYQRFGVIVTREDGSMERIVEKPSEPISKLANIGVYYIKDYELLFEGVNHVLNSDPGVGGEYFLTDAFQFMVDQGAKLRTAPVAGWYDCGKPETTIESNLHLLSTTRGGVDAGASIEGSEIVEPVRIEAGAVIRNSRIGPNVTIETGTQVHDSTLANALIGEQGELRAVSLSDSLVGDRVRLNSIQGSVMLASDSVVDPA